MFCSVLQRDSELYFLCQIQQELIVDINQRDCIWARCTQHSLKELILGVLFTFICVEINFWLGFKQHVTYYPAMLFQVCL